jgi:hypothetical protein
MHPWLHLLTMLLEDNFAIIKPPLQVTCRQNRSRLLKDWQKNSSGDIRRRRRSYERKSKISSKERYRTEFIIFYLR